MQQENIIMIKFVLSEDKPLCEECGTVIPAGTFVEFTPTAYLRNLGLLEPFTGKNRKQQKEFESMTLKAIFVDKNASHKFDDGTFSPIADGSDNAKVIYVEEVDYCNLAEFMDYYSIVRKEVKVTAYCPECEEEHEF